MDIGEIRHKNLLGILATGITQADFARKIGSTPATISQYVVRHPYPSGKLRSIGHDLARKIELGMGMEHGAFDSLQDWGTASTSNLQSSQRLPQRSAAAWLVTGGRMHADVSFVDVTRAAEEVVRRSDGSLMEPLFRAGAPTLTSSPDFTAPPVAFSAGDQ